MAEKYISIISILRQPLIGMGHIWEGHYVTSLTLPQGYLLLFLYQNLYNGLVMARDHPQHTKNGKITTTMVTEPFALPVACVL